MKKGNVIIASILGFLILCCVALLVARPFVLAKDEKQPENSKPSENIEPNSEQDLPQEGNNESEVTDEKLIQLGVNTIYSGTGINVDTTNNIITINEGGTYKIVGNLMSGFIIIDTSSDVTLNFEGVKIDSNNTIIDIKQDNKVIFNTTWGTINELTSLDQSVIKSNGVVEINGNGTLNITSLREDGILAKNVVVNGGVLNVVAMQDDFKVTEGYTLNGGEVVLLGCTNIDTINTSSTLKTMLFKLNNKLNTNDEVSIVDSTENILTTIRASIAIDTIIIGNNNIKNDTYNLIKDYNNTKEKIMINDQDSFGVNDTINSFK